MAFIMSGDGGGGADLNGELIWTNPTPTTGAQWIQMLTAEQVEQYDFFRIVWASSTTNLNTTSSTIISKQDIKKMNASVTHAKPYIGTRSSSANYVRAFWYNYDSSHQGFWVAGNAQTLGSGTDNNGNIPLTVYGLNNTAGTGGNERWIALNTFSANSGSNSNCSEFIYTFQQNYEKVMVVVVGTDTDNNGDNYHKVFDEKKSSTAFTAIKNDMVGAWDKIDFSEIAMPSGLSITMNGAYDYSADKNKTLTFNLSSNNQVFQTLFYKNDVLIGESANMYINTYRRCLVTVLGIPKTEDSEIRPPIAGRNPIMSLATNYYKNDSGAVPSNTYSIPDNGKYLILGVFTASKYNANCKISTDFTCLNVSLNGTDYTSTRILDDSLTYEDKGVAIEAVVVDAHIGDSLVTSITGVTRTGDTASILIFESLFMDITQSNIEVIAQSETKFNTADAVYNIYPDVLNGRSCFALNVVRTNAMGNRNTALTISNEHKTLKASDVQFDLLNPNNTNWMNRFTIFYPMSYYGDNSIIEAHIGNVSGDASKLAKIVVIGV